MKILITGANGLLGQHLVNMLTSRHTQLTLTGRGPSRYSKSDHPFVTYLEADLGQQLSVKNVMQRSRPDVVIHAGAMTQVDICEQERDAAYHVNVKSTRSILTGAEATGAHVIYLSTDFVFDGIKGNYNEMDATGPVNWYGYTKLEAEELVFLYKGNATVVRTCLVFGDILYGTRSNIISWVKENLEDGKEIKVVDDQVRTPTYVKDLVSGIEKVIEKKATGIFHISGNEIFTPYDLAIRTAHFFELNESLIKRVNASTFTQPGRRPAKTGFDISKAINQLDYHPRSFDSALRDMSL